MTAILRTMAILLSALPVFMQAAEDTNIVATVTGRFQPSKAAVLASYDVNYALLNIRLKRVAGATIQATEGFWRSSSSNARTPACLIDFHVASPRTEDEGERGNIRLFKRTVCVLTLPELRLITYAKHNDEFIKPLFMKGRRMQYVEIYNFESGAVSYRHHDLVSGAVETNLPGMAELAKQSTEMAGVLQALYGAYRDGVKAGTAAHPVHFNVDGAVRTFMLKMKKGRTVVPVFARKLSALYADIQPAKDGDSRNESFSMWCMPFRDFSAETADPHLKTLAATSVEFSMLPLAGEYGLFLGSIQCTLTNICARPMTERKPNLHPTSL